jgi:hypothetical protein
MAKRKTGRTTAPTNRSRRAPKRSVVYSTLIVFGMLVATVGLVVTILGLSVSNQMSELSGFGVDLKTASSGLILLVVGVGLSAILVLKKPADIELFSPDSQPTLLDRVRWRVPIVAGVVGGIALVGLIVSLVVN